MYDKVSKLSEDQTYLDVSQVSKGSQVGFLEGIERSWKYSNLYESQLGVAQALLDAEYENSKAIKKAGGKEPESAYFKKQDKSMLYIGFDEIGTRDRTSALDIAGRMAKAQADGDFGLYDAYAAKQDEELRALQKSFPDAGIKTYNEMYQGVRSNYDKMKVQLEQDYTTGGTIGWVAGGMAAGLNPNTSPLSAITAPIGGGGKNILMRMLGQAATQGVVQGLEEVTGVRANKQMLGENPSVGESIGNIAFAAAGGAALQGAGEAASFMFKGAKRRWFNNSKNDPAPLPPVDPVKPVDPTVQTGAAPGPVATRDVSPLSTEAEARLNAAVSEVAGTSRASRRVGQVDFQYVMRNLEDWGGPRPWEIAPPTHSRLPDAGGVEKPFKFDVATKGETVDEIARRIDPETFRVYDKLAKEKETFRKSIADALALKDNAKLYGEIEPLQKELTALEEKIANANKRKAKIYEVRRTELKAKIADTEAKGVGADDMATAAYRQAVLDRDTRMRDLAPAVSRAYARAKGKWQAYEGQRAQIEQMTMRGETKVPNDYAHIVDAAENAPREATVREAVPELNRPGVIQAENESAIDTTLRAMDEQKKMFDKAIEDMKTSIPKMLKLEGEEATIDIQGIETKLRLSDEYLMDDGNGNTRTVSVRKMLQEIDEDNEIFGAIQTCSVGAISATA
jgi:hypothetical protein